MKTELGWRERERGRRGREVGRERERERERERGDDVKPDALAEYTIVQYYTCTRYYFYTSKIF